MNRLERVRKTSAALASLSLVALALTGCSVSAPNSFDGQICDRASSTSGIDDSITVSGEFGQAPDVQITAPVTVDRTSYTDIIEGSGTAITSGSQVMSIDYAFYNGDSGTQIQQTSFDGTGSLFTSDLLASSVPGLADALACATPGTRLVAAISPEDAGTVFLSAGDAASQTPAVTEDTSLIAVFDVLDVKLARAEGSLVFNDARNLPTVVRAADGRPGIIVPKVDAPTTQTVQVLIKGDGAEITADDATTGVWVNYTSVGWDSREQIATTWDGNPVATLSDVSATLPDALVGQTVGSQLLVVEPGAEGAAATVYVIDILGTAASGQ